MYRDDSWVSRRCLAHFFVRSYFSTLVCFFFYVVLHGAEAAEGSATAGGQSWKPHICCRHSCGVRSFGADARFLADALRTLCAFGSARLVGSFDWPRHPGKPEPEDVGRDL